MATKTENSTKKLNIKKNGTAGDQAKIDSGCHKIRDVAKEFNLTLRTLRYYEEIGLISPLYHNQGSERVYDDDELIKIIKIKEMQDLLGFKLTEIKEILDTESKFDQLKTEFHSAKDDMQKISILQNALKTNKELTQDIDKRILKLKKYKTELHERHDRIVKKLNEIKQ
jgi:DNA-binding transcriptional MerR regulator